jgi:hypothetical protein
MNRNETSELECEVHSLNLHFYAQLIAVYHSTLRISRKSLNSVGTCIITSALLAGLQTLYLYNADTI